MANFFYPPVSSPSTLPLPAGASTSALQGTGNTSLNSIDSKTPALGQALAAASSPVVLTASQLSTLTPLSTIAATQSGTWTVQPGNTPNTVAWKVDGSAVTQPVSIASSIAVTGPLTDTQLRASAVPVSNASLPLPTGAATSALQTALNAQIPTSLGAKVTAASLSVNIASDQTVPVSASALPLPSGASTSALQTTGNTSLSSIDTKTPALGQALAASSVPIVLTASQLSTLTPLSSVTVTQATGTNLHAVIDSGVITSITNSVAVTAASLPLPTGASTSANQTTLGSHTTKINDGTNTAAVKAASTAPAVTDTALVVSISPNSGDPAIGPVSAGTAATRSYAVGGLYNSSLPTLTNGQQAAVQLDSSGRQLVNVATSAPSVGSVGVSNAPIQNIYSTTNILTSAYVQLVASTTSATNYLDIFDSSGQGMILATGAAASEVILAYLPPGGDQIFVQIPAGTRIAYKALSANATSGYLLINFWK